MRIFILLLFISFSISVSAQERLDDLVPYRKGKLWGLVHHDMKEFYPPVFDTIFAEAEEDDTPEFSVFREKSNKQMIAKVVYHGKPMCLTAAKKLILCKEEPFKGVELFSVEGLADTKVDIDANPGNNDDATIVEEFYSDSANANKVIVKRRKDSLYFYINNVYLPEFTCNDYTNYDHPGSAGSLLTLKKGKSFAAANPKTKKLLIAFEYSHVFRPYGCPLMVIAKQKLYGVLDADGKILIPLNYDELKWVCQIPGNIYLFIAIKDKKNFFIKASNAGMRESDVKYDQLSPCFEDRAGFFSTVKAGKKGIVSEDNKEIVPFIYDHLVSDRYSRFLLTRLANKRGFIDSENKLFTRKPVYDEMSDPMQTGFKRNNKEYYVFRVRKGSRSFYVDNFGKEFISK